MAELSPVRVLVIDDEADARANLEDILELDGCQVETAGSAAEALRRDSWPHLTAILLDRKLPDGSAEELLPRLRELAPQAAILIVTGYTMGSLYEHKDKQVQELREKVAPLSSAQLEEEMSATPAGATEPTQDSVRADALSALLNLGYQKSAAEKAIDSALTEADDTSSTGLGSSL